MASPLNKCTSGVLSGALGEDRKMFTLSLERRWWDGRLVIPYSRAGLGISGWDRCRRIESPLP